MARRRLRSKTSPPADSFDRSIYVRTPAWVRREVYDIGERRPFHRIDAPPQKLKGAARAQVSRQRDMSDGHNTIVFVHGSGDSSRVWQPLIARLPEVHCVALDLPGHGSRIDSPGPARMSVADYAADVRREVEGRDLHGICVAGHSLGGAIALQMAADYPSLVTSLALVGTGARLRVAPRLLELAESDPQGADQMLESLAWAPGHEGLARSYQPEKVPTTAPGMLYRDLAACDTFDMMGDLERIGQPVIVITGELDQMTPPKYARYLQEHLPHAMLALIPGAGHYAPYEQPDAVAEALREWLAR